MPTFVGLVMLFVSNKPSFRKYFPCSEVFGCTKRLILKTNFLFKLSDSKADLFNSLGIHCCVKIKIKTCAICLLLS